MGLLDKCDPHQKLFLRLVINGKIHRVILLTIGKSKSKIIIMLINLKKISTLNFKTRYQTTF